MARYMSLKYTRKNHISGAEPKTDGTKADIPRDGVTRHLFRQCPISRGTTYTLPNMVPLGGRGNEHRSFSVGARERGRVPSSGSVSPACTTKPTYPRGCIPSGEAKSDELAHAFPQIEQRRP